MDAEEWAEVQARARERNNGGGAFRKALRVLGSILVVIILGYATLAGLFGLTTICSDDWLFGRDCSALDHLGFLALLLAGLVGLPFSLWLIWHRRE